MSTNINNELVANPNEELSVPKWINETYFEKILKGEVSNFSHIVSFRSIAATAPGENYTSITIRVLIDVELKDGTLQPTSYIVKTSFETGFQVNFFKAMHLFPREKQMYQIHLPKFEQLYKEIGLKVQFGPKCFHVDDTTERITLLMEDLSRKQFVNMDRLKGLDMDHTTMVLKKIAELHAVSALYYEINGPFDDIFLTSQYNEQSREKYEIIADTRRAAFLRALPTWGLEHVEYYLETAPEAKFSVEESIRLNKVDPNEFNVLNHGDCWTNNIMFQHDDNGIVKDVLLLDYQVCKWGSPAQDLWFFLTISTEVEIKVTKFDHFIFVYHEHLAKCLKKLKYPKPIPTLKELHIMLLKYSYWAVVAANTIMTVALYPSDKESNIETLLKNGPEAAELRYKLFTSPYYAAAVRELYPFFKDKGIWQITQRE